MFFISVFFIFFNEKRKDLDRVIFQNFIANANEIREGRKRINQKFPCMADFEILKN